MATSEELEEPGDDSGELLAGTNSHGNLSSYMTATNSTDLYSLQNVRDFITRGDVDFDQRNEQGQTALMRACLERNKEVVQFLLEKGADPNLRCLEEGNTALHYVSQCHWSCGSDSETDLEDCEPFQGEVSEAEGSCKNFLTRESRNSTYDRLISKYNIDGNIQCPVFKKQKRSARIIDILISEYGALMQVNNNGLTAADIAGLNRKLSTVLHYINKGYIPKSEQIRALEILGTSLTLKDDYEKAYFAFTMAMEIRTENPSTVPENVVGSELEQCLGRSECRNLNDLRKINGDRHAMKVEGILVGDRVLPDSLKPQFVYECLVDYGYRLLFLWNTLDEAFEVFTECLRLERKGLMPVGRVLLSLTYSISQATSSPSLHRLVPQYVSKLRCSLNAYVDVIKEVNLENLASHVQEILINLSMVLYSFTNHLCRIQGVNCVLEPVVKMIKVIWSRLTRDSVVREPYRHLTNSVGHKLLCDMIDHFRYYYDSEKSKYTCYCFRQVLVRLVQVEGATDIDMKGDTLLHSLMGLVSFGEIQMIVDLAHLFLRYGCQSHTKNNAGKMPIDIAQEEASSLGDCYLPDLTELYCLLSPTVLPLQELAIRTILRCNVHYQDSLPRKLCSLLSEPFLDDRDALQLTSRG